jgi:hypothetical protein
VPKMVAAFIVKEPQIVNEMDSFEFSFIMHCHV